MRINLALILISKLTLFTSFIAISKSFSCASVNTQRTMNKMNMNMMNRRFLFNIRTVRTLTSVNTGRVLSSPSRSPSSLSMSSDLTSSTTSLFMLTSTKQHQHQHQLQQKQDQSPLSKSLLKTLQSLSPKHQHHHQHANKHKINLIISLSGGSDSTALLHCLMEVLTPTPSSSSSSIPEYRLLTSNGAIDDTVFTVKAVYFNHLTRPPLLPLPTDDDGKHRSTNDDDITFLSNVCKSYGVDLQVETWPSTSENGGINKFSQDKARKWRQGTLIGIAVNANKGERERERGESPLTKNKNNSRAYILTAHTANDQTETMLLKLLRGVNILNFRGMESIRHVHVDSDGYNDGDCDGEGGGSVMFLRPFLEVSKSALVSFIRSKSLDNNKTKKTNNASKTNKHREETLWIEDPSNTNTGSQTYRRNRIRNEVLPLFYSILNVNVNDPDSNDSNDDHDHDNNSIDSKLNKLSVQSSQLSSFVNHHITTLSKKRVVNYNNRKLGDDQGLLSSYGMFGDSTLILSYPNSKSEDNEEFDHERYIQTHLLHRFLQGSISNLQTLALQTGGNGRNRIKAPVIISTSLLQDIEKLAITFDSDSSGSGKDVKVVSIGGGYEAWVFRCYDEAFVSFDGEVFDDDDKYGKACVIVRKSEGKDVNVVSAKKSGFVTDFYRNLNRTDHETWVILPSSSNVDWNRSDHGERYIAITQSPHPPHPLNTNKNNRIKTFKITQHSSPPPSPNKKSISRFHPSYIPTTDPRYASGVKVNDFLRGQGVDFVFRGDALVLVYGFNGNENGNDGGDGGDENDNEIVAVYMPKNNKNGISSGDKWIYGRGWQGKACDTYQSSSSFSGGEVEVEGGGSVSVVIRRGGDG